MQSSESTCISNYRSSFFSLDTTPGKLIRVALAVAAVTAALIIHFGFAVDLRITVSVALLPLPLLFVDGIICAATEEPKIKNKRPFSFHPTTPEQDLNTAIDSGKTERVTAALNNDAFASGNIDIMRDGEPLLIHVLYQVPVNESMVQELLNSGKFNLNVASTLNKPLIEIALTKYDTNVIGKEIVFNLLQKFVALSKMTTHGWILLTQFLYKENSDPRRLHFISNIHTNKYPLPKTNLLIEDVVKTQKDENAKPFLAFFFELLKDISDFNEAAKQFLKKNTVEDGKYTDVNKYVCEVLETFVKL